MPSKFEIQNPTITLPNRFTINPKMTPTTCAYHQMKSLFFECYYCLTLKLKNIYIEQLRTVCLFYIYKCIYNCRNRGSADEIHFFIVSVFLVQTWWV